LGDSIRNPIVIIFLVALIVGCASSRISSLPTTSTAVVTVKAIALAPDGGLLADAVGVELANRGFIVIDSASTSTMMVRLNLNEVEIQLPAGLSTLKDQGIDAYLTVRAAGGYDDRPSSAGARMNSTTAGQVLAGVTW
jgi:hypothetical protein